MKTRTIDAPTGLCRTCDRVDACTYPNRNSHPVLYCLEFEEASMADIPAQPRTWRMRVGTVVGEVRAAGGGGLCATCDGRDTCTFPRGPAGSLFCEEYR